MTSRRPSRCVTALLTIAALAVACAGRAPTQTARPAAARPVAAVAEAYFVATEGPEPAAPDALRAVYDELAQGARDVGGVARRDPALIAGAERFAADARVQFGEELVPPDAAPALWRAGVANPGVEIVFADLERRLRPGALRRALADGARASRWDRVGAARGDDGAGHPWLVVFAARQRLAVLAPLPRRVAPGREAVVHVQVAPEYRAPRLVVARPDGTTWNTRGDTPDATRLRAAVTFAAEGEYRVEVVADDAGGGAVVANLRVIAGDAPEGASSSVSAVRLPTVEAIEGATLDAINRARLAAGVAPVRPHAVMREVARAHSARMLAARRMAHTLPGEASPDARVAQAVAGVTASGENCAADGYSAEVMHQTLMDSPGHRAILLDPRWTDVGVGAAGDGDASYLTEDFARIAPSPQGAP